MIVRTLIEEALNRANIVPKRQTAQGYQLEVGLRLLQGIVNTYNADNYLAFTQSSVDLPARALIHIYDKEDTMLGEYNYVFKDQSEMNSYVPSVEDKQNDAWAVIRTNPQQVYGVVETMGAYHWEPIEVDEFDARRQDIAKYCDAYHIKVANVAKLNTLCINRGDIYGMLKLHFLPHQEFDSYVANELFWTFVQLAEGEWVVKVKPVVANSATKLRLDYNKNFKVDMDTDVRIPDNYLELLIVSLTHKLALKYPRVDEAQMTRLAHEVDVMLDNVSTPKADTKFVTRDSYGDRGFTQYDLMSGRFLY